MLGKAASGASAPAIGPSESAEQNSFPTEQRLKQKARAKAGHIAKKRPQVVEDHHDFCGEDFGPLGDDDERDAQGDFAGGPSVAWLGAWN